MAHVKAQGQRSVLQTSPELALSPEMLALLEAGTSKRPSLCYDQKPKSEFDDFNDFRTMNLMTWSACVCVAWLCMSVQ